MTTATGPERGFLAVSPVPRHDARAALDRALRAVRAPAPVVEQRGGLLTATWGLDSCARAGTPLLLCHGARRRDADLTAGEVHRLLRGGAPEDLSEVLPTFAAVDVDDGSVAAAADALGFRHLYVAQTPDLAVLSTSCRAAGAVVGAELDREAWAVQSLLGWQLEQRTVLSGVAKLAPAEHVLLRDGRLVTTPFAPAPRSAPALDEAVEEAAHCLRRYLGALLDDHPDAILQLTGGQDSRLLLSAVPRERRRGLRAVTLGVPGNPDLDIAADLARRYGLDHEVLTLGGLEDLDPADADRLCLDAARRLEGMADPLAHAALTVAESRSLPGPRICGLGGEVARGFYYLGRDGGGPVTRRRVERLAGWRMFANESVPAEALDPEFAGWAREVALDAAERALSRSGLPWFEATDDLYLGQRMQRWAGVTETAVCFDRLVVNPMLDDRFLSLATALAPGHKRNSIFLSRLQVALDTELAHLPLDGRPAPAAFARRSLANSARQASTTAGKAVRKARQRLRGANRAPAGGEVLAAKAVEQWRAHPESLADVARLGILRPEWLESVLAGRADPSPSAVALVTNLRIVSPAGGPKSSTNSDIPPEKLPKTGSSV